MPFVNCPFSPSYYRIWNWLTKGARKWVPSWDLQRDITKVDQVFLGVIKITVTSIW